MKKRTTICTTAWAYAQGEPLVVGQRYNIIRAYWYNGEGWYEVERDGNRTKAPDIFFAD